MARVNYSADDRQQKIEQALEYRYTKRANWEEIADELDIARSTLNEWRKADDWKEADARWRKMVREQVRGDITQMADEAVEHIYMLMKTAKSPYVQYMSATKILELASVGNEIEEQVADQQKELNEFLLAKARREAERARVQLTVQNGGILPAEIQAANEAYKARKLREQGALEAEFRQVSEGEVVVAAETLEGDD